MGPPTSTRNNITPGPSIIFEDIHNIGPWSAGPSYTGYYVQGVKGSFVELIRIIGDVFPQRQSLSRIECRLIMNSFGCKAVHPKFIDEPRCKLTEQEILELKNYLPEWTAAKQHEKTRNIHSHSLSSKVVFSEARPWIMEKEEAGDASMQIYKTWLFNNKKKKETKDMIKYGRKWTPRMVVYQQNRDDVLKKIEAEYGVKPGAPDMFKYYQATIQKAMEELSDEELEKAKEKANKWSNNIPPPEIQVQVTSKKGPAYMEHFSNEMWRQCGMRVFVLSTWKNEQGQVLFGTHDDNEALGDGDSFMKTKDWEDIEPMWQEYAQAQFNAKARDGEQQEKGHRKRPRKPAFELDVNGEGIPSLPDTVQTKLEEKKAIVRAFLTTHYFDRMCPGLCSGIDKAVVPWSAIIECEDDFISPMYLPSRVHLKDPLKLQNSDATALLNFWYAHQENGDDPIFLFKAWKNTVGNMMKPASTRGSDKSHACIPHRGIMIRRPQDSSTESEIDGQLHHALAANAHRFSEDSRVLSEDDEPGDDDSGMDEDGARTVHQGVRVVPGPLSARNIGQGVQHPLPKPCPMGDLLAGLTCANRGVDCQDEAATEEETHVSPVPKGIQQQKKVIVGPPSRTRSKTMEKSLDIPRRVTRARAGK
ncbi:uncharacterized protein EDB91DRAFT_1088135 [Suillus paluster]|uniref:uncharacterized protein n=1 Tax=Suillus paluster TaxID=48578 RepID=UPI001B860971|nr:uncharacterized protein EDB91DRAFT_1088135 [Suillus paluster]KAG1722446.1 hypothetical protein EDB91DRAFT_1088135 [Suillus paluster]